MRQQADVYKAASVRTVQELLDALQQAGTRTIDIEQDLFDVPPFALPYGKVLQSRNAIAPTLSFAEASEALRLEGDNTLRNLRVQAQPAAHAILLAPEQASVGKLRFERVTTVGRVTLIVGAQESKGTIQIQDLAVEQADALSSTELPKGFGVSVLQGAFTLWVKGAGSSVAADLMNLTVGRIDAPVRGSGVFVAGADFGAETLYIQRLQTGPVYSNGGITSGTPDKITGGVFVLQGARADLVENLGPVTTYGVNDMALDNWGTVERWIAHGKVTTFGESGIGFVNFGELDSLEVKAPIETHGLGARGFNVYDGTVRKADFEKITTRGDGAVGVQISRPVGRLRFRRGIETFGGSGLSLVKGVQQQLKAIALSVKAEGVADALILSGDLITHGKGVPALEQDGRVKQFEVHGVFACEGGS